MTGPALAVRALAAVALLAAAIPGEAQPPAPADGLAPAARDAPPAAAPATFDSAFRGYRAFNAEEPLLDWRKVNDAMRALGGHAGHLAPQAAGKPAPHAAPVPPEAAKKAPAR